MQLKRLLVPLVAIVCLLGSVGIAQAFGWWQTSGNSLTTLANASVDDIKGSTTLSQVSSVFGIPQSELYSLLGLPASVSVDSKLKDLEQYIEVETVRERIAEYTGAPAGTGTPLPTAEATSAGTAVSAATSHAPSTPVPGQTLAAADIKGTMTLQQVSDQCGIPLDALYKDLGLKADTPASSVLKDLAAAGGPEITKVRDVVAAYQESHK